MASPGPKSPEQSDKSKKYDRQLRLWGDHGQAALESAHICLVNAVALGTEILKSLVLPAVGAFTIVDGCQVTDEDIGSNFFLDADSIGKSRAQMATQLLLELNPDVKGDYVDESVSVLLEKNPQFFDNFSVVIACSLAERDVLLLSKCLWSAGVPFVVAKSMGLLGYARLQFAEHSVIESHPDSQNPDLRLDRPFPSLAKYMDSIDLEAMDFKDHTHVPYVVPLYKTVQKWCKENGGKLPSTYKEKQKFREELRKGIRKNEDGVPEHEENFEEAIKAVNYAVCPTTIPNDIKDILSDDCCVNLTTKSTPFWIMAKAVKEFVENEGDGMLPLRGNLPDMTADTNSYIKLQQLYSEEAARHVEAVQRRIVAITAGLGLPADFVPEASVKLFCRHASDLAVLRGTSIATEYSQRANPLIAQGLENPDSLVVWYVMLRAIDRFYDEFNHYPGEFGDEPDISKLKSIVSKLLNEWGCSNVIKDDYIHEMCRYGGCELHSVSAFIGGCIAHEIIKLVTSQYKPINNTFIFDGISTTTETFFF